MSLIIVLVGAFGSVIGSFLNVVVHRVPRAQSIVHPPSACPTCGAAIRARDNIPMLSWLLLRGRCRNCAAPISARYPLVELGTAVAFALVAWRWLPAVLAAQTVSGTISAVLELIAFLTLAAASMALTMIDLQTHTLPNRIVLPVLGALAALLAVAGLLRHDPGAVFSAAIGGVGLFAFYLVLAVVSNGGMGFGDVKLAAVLGLATGWVGWPALAVGALAAFVLGGVFGLLLILLRKARGKTAIPFGPWMILGAWVGIVAGKPIVTAYLGIAGLA